MPLPPACSIKIDDSALFGRFKASGGEASTTLGQHYVKFQSPETLAAAAGFPMSGDVGTQEAIFHERYCSGEDLPGFKAVYEGVLVELIQPLLLGTGKVGAKEALGWCMCKDWPGLCRACIPCLLLGCWLQSRPAVHFAIHLPALALLHAE